MVTLALYNLKGGVGKTASSVNLAYLAAREGYKTLVWDMDPQGSSSFYLGAEASVKNEARKLLNNEMDLLDAIQPTAYENLSIIPADLSARHADILLNDMKQSKRKLASLLAPLKKEYAVVILDCPPGISVLHDSVFTAADWVVMPNIPTTLSIRSYDTVADYFRENDFDKAKLKCFFSMVDHRKNLHHEVMTSFYKDNVFFKSYIPYLSDVEKMGLHEAPLETYAPSSYAAQCYKDLWKEIKKELYRLKIVLRLKKDYEKRADIMVQSGIGKEMPVAAYGDYGFALLLIPTAAADYLEYERFQLIDALAPHINSGKMRVFSIDSMNKESWMNNEMVPEHKAIRQNQFNEYVFNEVVPFIRNATSSETMIYTCGASFGALHAMNLFLKRPDIINGVISMSGVYDLTEYTKGFWDDQVYYNSPQHYVPNLSDPWYLDRIRASHHIHIYTGSGSHEDPEASKRFAGVLYNKGIWYDLDVWGNDITHDWPTWRNMLPYIIDVKF